MSSELTVIWLFPCWQRDFACFLPHFYTQAKQELMELNNKVALTKLRFFFVANFTLILITIIVRGGNHFSTCGFKKKIDYYILKRFIGFLYVWTWNINHYPCNLLYAAFFLFFLFIFIKGANCMLVWFIHMVISIHHTHHCHFIYNLTLKLVE